MKTLSYNPSVLEVQFAQSILNLQNQLEDHIVDCKIVNVENKINNDNPMLLFQVVDKDGDKHEIVIKIIQRPDKI
jgi:hypothetical protein